jgi:chromosome segregation ATPase
MLLTIGLTGIALVGASIAVAGAVGSGVVATNNAVKNKRSALLEGAKAKRLEKQLEALEQSRQPVIDQSQKIRNLKNQVSNPYANLGVAMQSANLQIEQTDQALANTLETINATGMGAGGASALAKAAAQSKAGIAASIETQEANNQKLRIEGEQKAQDTKINIEKQALAEEVAAFERQDERDVAKMNRVAGLQDRASQNEMMYQQAAQEQSMQAMGAVTDLGTSLMGMGGPPGN